MASRLPVASAMVWMAGAPRSVGLWWHQWEKLTLNFCHSWTHAPVKVKVLGLVPPMGLTASGHCTGCVVMAQSWSCCNVWWVQLDYSLCLSVLWSLSSHGGPIITAKPRWQWHRQMWTGMSRSPSFSMLFGDGLGNQSLAFLQSSMCWHWAGPAGQPNWGFLIA